MEGEVKGETRVGKACTAQDWDSVTYIITLYQLSYVLETFRLPGDAGEPRRLQFCLLYTSDAADE